VACITRSPSSARLKSARASRKRRAPDATRIAAARRPNARSMRGGCACKLFPTGAPPRLFLRARQYRDGSDDHDGRRAELQELADLGFDHQPLVLAGDPEKAEAHLPMIHLVFSNLKTWLLARIMDGSNPSTCKPISTNMFSASIAAFIR